MLTLFGAAVVGCMMVFYALESKGPVFTMLFALGCFGASAYGFLAGTWPFGVVECAWGFVALRKWSTRRVREVSPL